MNILDSNIIIPKLVTQFSAPIFQGIKNQGSKAIQKFQVDFNTCFTEYLKRNFDKCSKTKTILYRQQPVNLKDFYVRTDLSRGYNKPSIEEHEFISHIQNNQRIVISGTAGSGKSTFCKSIFIDLIETQHEIVPIFVELRQINSEKNNNLINYIGDQLREFASSFTNEQLDYALKSGKILLIFDGFDEINNDKKNDCEKEIISLASKYHNIMIMVSSRHDERFISWEEFYTYDILPLDKVKAKKLIEKLDFDSSIKLKFLKALEEELYEKHQSFTGNPLLLTMMLLTYEQIAEIPDKIHLFYQEAFSTLFHRHDAFKSSYKRKTYTGLPIDEFKKLLSYFALLSYSKGKYYFSKDTLMDFFDSSLKISGINSDKEDFLNDLLFNVCILQKDGTEYTFTHRSFQEYFTALFLANYTPKNKFEIFDKIANLNRSDNVISMTFDINQDLLEAEWIVPRLESSISEFSFSDTQEEKLKNMAKLYPKIFYLSAAEIADIKNVEERESYPCIAFSLSSSNLFNFLELMSKLYRILYKNNFKSLFGGMKLSEEEKKYRKQLMHLDLIDGEKEIFLSDLNNINEETKIRIIKSGCYNIVSEQIEFARYLLAVLKAKHSKKEKDIAELILGN